MRKKRTLGVLAATFAAVTLPVVAASPASATVGDCTQYLRNMGYRVGPGVNSACTAGAGFPLDRWQCNYELILLGVRTQHVEVACYQASRPS
ncbi:hypothetical protein [Streptomyces sp. NPDC093225]|uniref:hypothetical protein n=1 Tax=Streptomyces sp. NPDC093225 TaxID=3366034 RepID=UPI003818E015